MTYIVIKALAPIATILFLGYWAGKARLANNENVSTLNVFLMDFALPGSLFLSTLQTPWSGIVRQAPLIFILALSMWTTYAIAYFISRKTQDRSVPDSAVLALTTALPNYAALGLPILNGGGGEGVETTLSVAVAISCGAVLITPVCLMSLEAKKRSEAGAPVERFLLPRLVTASFKKPIVFAPIAGAVLSFLLGLLGVRLPELVVIAIRPLGSAASGTALFLTGLILSARTGRTSVAVVFSTVLKNLAMPSDLLTPKALCWRAPSLSP